MDVRIHEPGKPEGKRAFDESRVLTEDGFSLGGDGADVAIPGAPAGALASVKLEGGTPRLSRLGGARVSVGGRDVAAGASVELPKETLLSLGGKDAAWKAAGGADGAGGGADSERPSLMAKDVLKQVFSALGVPEGDQPALVAYDAEDRLVKRIDLTDDDVTIGRSVENRLVLYHASVSSKHARVSREASGYHVHDLESKNGVEVNGAKIAQKTKLKSGDRIRLGQFTLRFVDPRAAAADLTSSVPDLKGVQKAKPGEKVEVGDRAKAAGVQETHTDLVAERPGATKTPAPAGDAAKGAAPAGGDAKAAPDPKAPPAKAPAPAPAAPEDGGGGLFTWILVGVGALILLGAVALIVLTLK